MIDQVMEWFRLFTELSKSNPVLAGIIGLYGAGILTYVSRDIPNKFRIFFEKQFTISMTVSNFDVVFNEFFKWYESKGFSETSRTLRVRSGYDAHDTPYFGAGFGRHYFWYNKRLFRLDRSEKELNNSLSVKEDFTITTYGRSRKPLEKMIEATRPEKNPQLNLTRIYRWVGDWRFYGKQVPRNMDSVVLPKAQKRRIEKHIEDFNNDEDWYVDNGIPYRTGILLHGPGGTGKTSVVRALCGKYKKDLYTINLNGCSDATLESAMVEAPENSIILIEDIDTFAATRERREDEKGNQEYSFLTLSGMLNAIDGVTGSKGRIIVATTNHIEALDPALIRKGRFDLHEEISYLNNDTFKVFFNRFYPEFNLDALKIKDKTTPADLQASIMEFKTEPEKVVETICEII